MCGGYRVAVAFQTIFHTYSPRVRGLSDQPAGFGAACLVFPPCAGVIGKLFRSISLLRGIPPVCGGYRSCCPRLPAGWKYSPRMRGLSEVFDLIQKGTDVFPPHAGVIALEKQKNHRGRGIPPVCGGYRLPMGKNLHL